MWLLNNCRCCLEEVNTIEDRIPLKSPYGKKTIAEFIESFLNVKIKDSPNLPQIICSTCLEKFLTAQQVKTLFLETEKALEKYENENEDQKLIDIAEEDPLKDLDDDFLEAFSDKSEVMKDSDSDLSNFSSDADEDESGKETKSRSKLTGKNKIVRIRFRASKSCLNNSSYQIPEEGDYPCALCPKVTNCPRALMHHVKIHKEKNQSPPLVCKTCNRGFYCATILEKHVNWCILKPICYLCPGTQRFPARKLAEQHMDECHRTKDKRDFICNYPGCEYRATSTYCMLNHLMSHYDPFDLTCKHCSRHFTDRRKYKNHLNRVHSTKRNLICDLCGVVLATRLTFLNHISSVHQKIRYHCEQCFQGFSLKYNLNQHKLAQHQRETSFKCSYCYLRFPDEVKRQLHQEKHESWGGKRRKNF